MEIRKSCDIHHGAILKENVMIGDNVEIGRGCIIYPNVIIKNNTKIEPYCEIGHKTKRDTEGNDFSFHSNLVKKFINMKNTEIGNNSIIRSQSIIYDSVRIGSNFRSGHRSLIREHSTIGDDCVVGSNAIVGGYCKIGDKSKIETSAFICQSVEIGRGVFIGPYTSFYDNKRIILGEGGLKGAIVEDYVRIGGGSKILPKVRIGKGALIGAGSVVTKDVPEKAVVCGNPAKIRYYQNEKEIKKYINSIENW